MFQEEEPAAKYPPIAEPPGKNLYLLPEKSAVDTPEQPRLPGVMGATFPIMCEFWLLTCKWTTVYYTSNSMPALNLLR